MMFRRRQLLGLGLLAVAAIAGGAWLLRLDYSRKISTDILDLMPAGGSTPELTLMRSLASEATARTMLFELTDASGQPAPAGAATAFATQLAQGPAFDQAVAMDDPRPRDAAGQALFEQRFTLLFPLWLQERATAFAAMGGAPSGFSAWLARDSADNIEHFLATPGALAFQDLIPADPLLLLPGAVDRLSGGLAMLAPVTSGAPPAALVWARLAVSPFSEAGQAPAFAAIARVTDAVRRDFPGLTVASTGVNRFAAAGRARIEHEVGWLNLLSLAAVLSVAFAFVRQAHRGLHLVPVVFGAVLGAWVCVTLAFDRVQILVLVIGSLLTGVAIDYGFYLFMQPPAGPEEDYWTKVRRLAKPLLASCLTTVAGFALLQFSELPFIRQLGVFVGSGLVCALATAVVYFSTVRNPYLAAREFRGGPRLAPRVRRGLRRLLIVAWVLALPGLALLRWNDDIRELEIPSPELTRESDRISARFGDDASHTVYLTYGATAADARAALERFTGWLGSDHAGTNATRETISLAAVIPTTAALAQAAAFGREHPEFPSQLRTALIGAGFDDQAFAPFFAAYARQVTDGGAGELEPALTALAAKLTGPTGLLLHVGQPLCWFVTMVGAAPLDAPPPDTHTVSADQLQSLNRIFAHYRESMLRLSVAGLALVGAGVLLTYGGRDGLRIFAIPCCACLGLFGVFGWLGHPLNLFYLLGAFLGVCLTHNYSIFTATSAYRGERPPVSVRVSALTAAASFGVLTLSGIPVVRALGSTVALMVIVALLMIEFEHLAVLGKKP